MRFCSLEASIFSWVIFSGIVKVSEADFMINRLHGIPSSSLSLISLLLILGAAGCASRSMALVHPQTGATAECRASGTGPMAATADELVGECILGYERQGYVRIEKLTPEQRAELERRGLLPKP
jgi:hypothetical protein